MTETGHFANERLLRADHCDITTVKRGNIIVGNEKKILYKQKTANEESVTKQKNSTEL